MTKRLIDSPIQRLIRSPFEALFTFGQPFISGDGFVLLDEDNNVLLASTASLSSASAPARPFISDDGAVLVDDNNNILIGA